MAHYSYYVSERKDVQVLGSEWARDHPIRRVHRWNGLVSSQNFIALNSALTVVFQTSDNSKPLPFPYQMEPLSESTAALFPAAS